MKSLLNWFGKQSPQAEPTALNHEESAMLLCMMDFGMLKITRLTSDMNGLRLYGLADVNTVEGTVTPTQLAYDTYYAWLEERWAPFSINLEEDERL